MSGGFFFLFSPSTFALINSALGGVSLLRVRLNHLVINALINIRIFRLPSPFLALFTECSQLTQNVFFDILRYVVFRFCFQSILNSPYRSAAFSSYVSVLSTRFDDDIPNENYFRSRYGALNTQV